MSPTAFDPGTCLLTELTQHIRDTHHAYLRAELPAIWTDLREALAARSAATAEIRMLGRLFGRFRATLESHLRKEEEILFPFVEQLERDIVAPGTSPEHRFGPLRLPIEILEGEHALGDRLLEQMRPVWRRWTPKAESPALHTALAQRLERLDADMARHVHLEDHVLFPRTIRLEGR